MKKGRKLLNGHRRAEMRKEYDFSGGIRGKHYRQYREGVSITIHSPNKRHVLRSKRTNTFVKLDSDVARVFRNGKAVNTALRRIIAASSKD